LRRLNYGIVPPLISPEASGGVDGADVPCGSAALGRRYGVAHNSTGRQRNLLFMGNNADQGVVSYRCGPGAQPMAVIVWNFTPVVRGNHRVEGPRPRRYGAPINTDAAEYAGSSVGNAGGGS
jgi:1,4-alpha-glucan branching enzyme